MTGEKIGQVGLCFVRSPCAVRINQHRKRTLPFRVIDPDRYITLPFRVIDPDRYLPVPVSIFNGVAVDLFDLKGAIIVAWCEPLRYYLSVPGI